MWQEVFQAIGFHAEKNNGDVAASQILLVFDASIHGQQNLELGSLCCCQRLAVF
jgi:hypothetical protein